MVVLKPPPPSRDPDPLHQIIPKGTSIFRIFDNERFPVHAETFRSYGPLERFDHHRGIGSGKKRSPFDDDERRIYYAALSFEGAVIETCFSETELIEPKETQHIARIDIARDLSLLDLRGRGSVRAGTVALIAKTSKRADSQSWSRFFYLRDKIYQKVDGLIYLNAHNDLPALALYERAYDAIHDSLNEPTVLPLKSQALRKSLLQIGRSNGLKVAPL